MRVHRFNARVQLQANQIKARGEATRNAKIACQLQRSSSRRSPNSVQLLPRCDPLKGSRIIQRVDKRSGGIGPVTEASRTEIEYGSDRAESGRFSKTTPYPHHTKETQRDA